MNHLKLSGIIDLISFLHLLERNKIWFRLDRLRQESVMVTIHMVSRRLEVDFFQDHIEYSWYDGDESVHDDQGWLYDVLEEWTAQ